MALYHFHVDRISRSEGQTAVSAAAYRSGEKLHDYYYGEEPDYTRKGGVLLTEIILPEHVPEEYRDREKLWNAVEAAEKNPRAQLAYSFGFALQNELDFEENSGVVFDGGNLTVLELVKRYVATKIGVRESTKAGYQTTINFLERNSFGQRRIDTIKISDAKLWLIALQQREGKGYSTLHTIRGILRPAFRMALDDDLIRKNPFDFELATVIVNDSVTRDALTRSEERKYLEFVKQDKHFSRYYEGIFILFNTGLRISEFVGLTLKNLDFAHHKIIVDHQLIRTSKMRYMIEEPKTECGIREIPMIKEVEEAFKIIISKRGKPKAEPVIDGYSGFLYLDKNDMPMVALHWEKYFQHILQKYNSIYKIQMPKVTPHVCRHTFCTNMAKSGMNPKSLQYIMGHAEISITLDHYTHINFEDAEAEMKKIATN